jgi:dolichol-phosphate mannosyltransferase
VRFDGPVGVAGVAVRIGFVALAVVRISRVARRPSPLEPAGTDAATGGSEITVVIPARDEAGRISPVLAAMVGAPGVGRVIVVDDHSSDDTAAVASAAGATVVAAPALPDGWAGKAWALQTGLGASTTDWVVTLDADTEPDPRLPGAMVARAIADDAVMLSVGGAFICPSVGAQWLHPAMLTTLVYRFGAPGTELRPDRLMANGQAMALARADVLAAGGLGLVAAEPVEDVALARALARRGLGVRFVEGSDLLAVRMYETAVETATGWGRSIALPGVEPRGRQLVDVGVVAVAQAGALWSMVRLVTGRGGLIDVVTAVLRIGTLVGTRRSYRIDAATHRVGYWLCITADPVAAVLLLRGVFRRRQRWRGRSYQTTPPARSAGR